MRRIRFRVLEELSVGDGVVLKPGLYPGRIFLFDDPEVDGPVERVMIGLSDLYLESIGHYDYFPAIPIIVDVSQPYSDGRIVIDSEISDDPDDSRPSFFLLPG